MSNLAELLEKKLHWINISGFQQCNFYSDIMLCCRDMTLALKSQLLSQNWAFFCL